MVAFIAEIGCSASRLRSTTGQHSKVQILINLADVVVRGQLWTGLSAVVHFSPMRFSLVVLTSQ